MSPRHETPTATGGKQCAINPGCLWTATATLVAIACFDLIEPIANLPLRVPRSFNEGWNAYWAATASSGGQLYPPMDALVSNNYPPASFFLVGLASKITGDPILAGRAIALLSFLLVAVNIILWLRRVGVRNSLAILSGAAFIVTLDALAHGMIGTDDPQWIGHALMTTGMLVLWRNPQSTPRLAGTAAMMMLGLWVKHLLIPMPATIIIWLSRLDRRALWKCIGFAATLGVLLLSASLVRYGHEFVDGVLRAPRRYLLARSVLMAYAVLPALFPILCLSSVLLRRLRNHEAARFARLYLVLAAIVAGIACTGDGVEANAYFDVAIAASLASGLALEEIAGYFSVPRGQHFYLKAVVLVSAVILISWTPFAIHSNLERLRALSARRQATPGDIDFMRQHGTRAAVCESLSLCFWSGAPFNFDFFNFGQKLKTYGIPIKACATLFDGTRFSVIQMYAPPKNVDARLPALCNRVITDNYEVARTSINGVFLVPRKAPSLSVPIARQAVREPTQRRSSARALTLQPPPPMPPVDHA